ncbi:REP-associated tyrosine transposase [Pelagovum pacificum]|uniref:Transposase n=1 Tax=Pelagovum pacificum TaxID=2588711 RepID=A0A5C5GA74_9RHOB|nr:transposase [Pelagovum pacificum]QQA41629.1 transposase [Pelagovum pacificum]TNY30908.1 transposase [Pelagovum pacificum]
MARYLRPRVPGAAIFFTVCLADRSSDLLVREIDRLRDAVRRTRAERPFGIEAWVVMPDHMHCVWRLPEGDRDYPVRWSVIKQRFSRGLPFTLRRASHARRRERGIWQRRYWEHHVRSEAELSAIVDYCHGNPVKHGLVARPEDWPYSSVHREVEVIDRGDG